jgi:hypothetical protein
MGKPLRMGKPPPLPIWDRRAGKLPPSLARWARSAKCAISLGRLAAEQQFPVKGYSLSGASLSFVEVGAMS